MVAQIVRLQDRRNQIDICNRPTEYARNAATPAKRNTSRYGEPGGSARPATYAVKMPTTSTYANHNPRFLPIDQGPLGITVRIMLGPTRMFPANSGDFISAAPLARGTM